MINQISANYRANGTLLRIMTWASIPLKRPEAPIRKDKLYSQSTLWWCTVIMHFINLTEFFWYPGAKTLKRETLPCIWSPKRIEHYLKMNVSKCPKIFFFSNLYRNLYNNLLKKVISLEWHFLFLMEGIVKYFLPQIRPYRSNDFNFSLYFTNMLIFPIKKIINVFY